MLSRLRQLAGPAIARVALGLAPLAIALTAGCASDSGTVSAQERAAKFRAENDTYASLGYRHVWTGFPSMTTGATLRSLDAFDDVLTVQDSAGMLSLLEASSGQTRWSDQLGNPLTRFVGVVRDDRRVICASETD